MLISPTTVGQARLKCQCTCMSTPAHTCIYVLGENLNVCCSFLNKILGNSNSGNCYNTTQPLYFFCRAHSLSIQPVCTHLSTVNCHWPNFINTGVLFTVKSEALQNISSFNQLRWLFFPFLSSQTSSKMRSSHPNFVICAGKWALPRTHTSFGN